MVQQTDLELIDQHINQVRRAAAECELDATRIGANLIELAEAAQKRDVLLQRLEQLQACRDHLVARLENAQMVVPSANDP